jgi:hypothetical protein
MIALIERLPADVVGIKVLSILEVEDLVRLGSALCRREDGRFFGVAFGT